MDREDQVDAGAKAIEPVFLDEIDAKSSEAEPRLVVSEIGTQDAAKPSKGET